LGSIIAQAAIAPLRTRGATKKNANPWLNNVMKIYAFFMLLGVFLTFLIPETARKTLENLAGEESDTANTAVTTTRVESAEKKHSDGDSPVAEDRAAV
jgi:PHS family inorganic phosphate transporter-like MFS transporter